VKDKGHAQNSRTMNELKNKKCCQGCKNGQPGRNPRCQAKLLMENVKQQQELLKEEEV